MYISQSVVRFRFNESRYVQNETIKLVISYFYLAFCFYEFCCLCYLDLYHSQRNCRFTKGKTKFSNDYTLNF